MQYKNTLLILLFALFVSGCSSIDETRTISLAHGLNINHAVHKAMLEMNRYLDSISSGAMKIEIYPSQQLGTERENIELLQIGSLDMTKVSAGVLENFAPKMKIFGLPFLFRDKKHTFDVLDGPIGKDLLRDSEKYWLKGMGYYDAGSRSFYTKKNPINSPKDLNGLKIRVMESVSAMDMVNALGGSPTPISWGELYTALQQGVVDGAENNPPTFFLSRHYEVCKFYTLDEHSVLPDVLIASTHLWERLSKQEQVWLQEAVDYSVGYQRKLWAIAETDALIEVKKAGVKVIRPDKTLFSDKVNGIYEEYKSNAVIYNLFKQIQNTKIR